MREPQHRDPGDDTGTVLSQTIREHLESRARNASHSPQPSSREHGSPTAPSDARPPAFLFAEVVRLKEVTGDETDDLGRIIDVTPILGRELVVQGATPTTRRDGWMIHLDVAELGGICHFPEGALVHTGWIEVVDEHGDAEQVPLDPTRHRPWRDDVMLELELDTSCEQASALAEIGLEAIKGLTGTNSVDYRIVESPGGGCSTTYWIYSDDDALDSFEELTGLVDSGWRIDQDDGLYISSRWERGAGQPPFLSPVIRSAELTYRRWLSPERRSRRDDTARRGR